MKNDENSCFMNKPTESNEKSNRCKDCTTDLQCNDSSHIDILPFTTCGSIPPSLEGRIDALESPAQMKVGTPQSSHRLQRSEGNVLPPRNHWPPFCTT